jgi:tetratricopeptide (TPR) repeat protein
VRSVLGEVESRDRLASSLTSVISATKERADRGRLRVGLARLLLEEPPRNAAAIGALEEALADDPNDQETLEVLSDALEREGRFDELASVLERCVSALAWEAHAPPVRAVEWRLGHALEKAGRSSEARDLYEGILDREPTDRDLVSRLAARLDALGSERLADCLERWIAIDPTAAPGIANRVVELRDRRGDRQGAARALETAFSIDPTHADIRDRLIAQYEERGQWAEAAGALRRAIDASPKSKGLFPKLVEAYRRAGDQEALLGALDAALTKRSRDAELLALRAQAREERGDVAGAIADLESASTVDAKRLGALLDLLERVAAHAQTPAEEAHLIRMAEILTRLNRPKEALAALERLRVRNPSHRDALHRIALTASATEDWGAAANAYRDLVALLGGLEPEKEALGLATALVDAFQRAGRSAEARGPLGRVVDAYASSPSAEPELERLCEAAGDWGRLAELLVGRAERQSGADQKVGLLVQAARLRLEKGADAKGALSVIEQARAIAPGSTEALLVWSRAQVALGHSDVALAALGEASGKGRVAAPVLASLQLEIARAHLAADGLVEAWNALKAAFVADARHAEIALLLGLLSLDLEDEKTAERALTVVTKTASRVEPAQKARAYFHLARMAQAKGDVAKARLLASKAVESDPRQLGAKTLLAKLAASPAH